MSNSKPKLQCPLCGQNNQCSVAADKPAQDCWCVAATISAAKLKDLPEAERGMRCICPACAGVKLPTADSGGEPE